MRLGRVLRKGVRDVVLFYPAYLVVMFVCVGVAVYLAATKEVR